MAEWLVDPIVSDLGLSRGDTVLAFVNGMGGTPLIELYVAFNSVAKILGGQGISIGRILVGNYITSLEMAGFSVTLLRLDDDLARWWDAPVHTAGAALGRLTSGPSASPAAAGPLPRARRPRRLFRLDSRGRDRRRQSRRLR